MKKSAITVKLWRTSKVKNFILIALIKVRKAEPVKYFSTFSVVGSFTDDRCQQADHRLTDQPSLILSGLEFGKVSADWPLNFGPN